MAGNVGTKRSDPFLRYDFAFQPIVDLQSNDILAYEALIRGPRGEPAASVLDRISDRDKSTFQIESCSRALGQAIEAGLLDTDAHLALNIIPHAMPDPARSLAPFVATLRAFGLERKRIIFEISECGRCGTEDLRTLRHGLRALSFGTAMDDFGAGHSGLNRLADLTTDFVKLDIGLIRGIDHHRFRRKIAGAMVALASDLGRECIAEGVETPGELETVRSLGIRYAQGFFLARPAFRRLPTVGVPPASDGTAAPHQDAA